MSCNSKTTEEVFLIGDQEWRISANLLSVLTADESVQLEVHGQYLSPEDSSKYFENGEKVVLRVGIFSADLLAIEDMWIFRPWD